MLTVKTKTAWESQFEQISHLKKKKGNILCFEYPEIIVKYTRNILIQNNF